MLAIKIMRIITTIMLFFVWANCLYAQKVRLVGDSSKYLCLNDSIAQTFSMSLKKAKIDSTIKILYDYDNGRLPNSVRAIIWTHDGVSNIRFIRGCDRITKDTIFTYNLDDLWKYIKMTHFDDVSIPIESGTGQSHDKCYSIEVTTPTKSLLVVVRDNERKSTEKYKYPEADSRVMLANKVDSLLR